MRFTFERVLGSNITIVYEGLDIAKVSRDAIRQSISPSNLFDTEDLLVVIAPPGVLVQVAEQRVVVSDQTGSSPGKVPLWSFAAKMHHAIPGAQVSAYGFNYDVGVMLEEGSDALSYLTNLFVPNAGDREKRLEVESLAFVPHLLYKKGAAEYDFRFDPAKVRGQRLAVHLNANLTRNALPSEEVLNENYVSEFDEISRILRLL